MLNKPPYEPIRGPIPTVPVLARTIPEGPSLEDVHKALQEKRHQPEASIPDVTVTADPDAGTLQIAVVFSLP